MGRVFDALQRQDKNGQRPGEHDSFAAKNGASDMADEIEPLNDFELPDRIGAPSGPRSSEGVILPFMPEEQLTGAAFEMPEPEPSPRVTAPLNSATQKPPAVEPAPRYTASTPNSELRTPPTPLRREYIPPHTIKPQTWLMAQLDQEDLHARLVMATEPQAPGCEQYRTLRTQVFHAAERRLAQVIVMTSATAGEGKTSTALNLAFAIAQSKEKRVLVIDSDLRQPEVARHLGLDPEKGLSQVLNGECDVMRAVIHATDSNLYILPAGGAAANPAELLSSERLSDTLAELRQYFDFILVDSPPVMPFADARLLAHHADAVIMVVRAGAAPYSTVEQAIEALPAGRFLGVVLNGAHEADHNKRYGKRRLFDWLSFGKRKR